MVWALLAGLGGMAVGCAVGMVLGWWWGGSQYLLLGLPGAVLGAAAGLWAGLVRRRSWGWAQMGFVFPRRSPWHLCWQVPVALLASLSCALTVGALAGWATATSEESVFADAVTVTPWLMVTVALSVVVLLPAVEEVIFRRVLLGWLLTRMPKVVAVVVAAAGFAVIHVAPTAMLYLFFLAVAAGLLYLWHRSLWAPLALHVANNGLALALVALALKG